jgi:anti-sigma-K factor RskA
MSDSSTVSISHDNVFAQLGALALGAVEEAEARKFMQHVDSCDICKVELTAMKNVAAQLPSAPSAGTLAPERSRAVRAALIERAATTADIPVVVPKQSASNVWRPLAIAATLAFAIAGGAYYKEKLETAELTNVIASRTAVAESLAAIVREREAQLASITGPGVFVVELTSNGVRAPSARMFWDRATNKWTIYAHGLPALAPGRDYELWLISGDRKIPAGTFKPQPDGSATFTATYALDRTALTAIAVTEEPEGGVAVPTGSIVLVGAATGS